ncbi:MAG TPA: hypothetical protein VK444_03260, partial [Methanobacteriaceae archaeon]|nr:hypothetical protein [Methanobacteriaceae archaeon]
MKGRIGLLSILLITLAVFLGAAAAAEPPSADIEQVNLTGNNSTVVSESFISGNITRCTNGQPFPGVTVTVNSLTGTEITHTTADQNGFYQLSFYSNERNFIVSASHPGHMTITKEVVMQQDLNDSNFYGFSNFMLGPEPTVVVGAPAEQFLNETFDFTLTFNNVGNETGFGPIVQLIVPPEIEFNPSTVTFLTAPVSVTYVGNFTTGSLIDPLSGLTVNGPNGYRLYILEYPLGSFTTGQPNAVININALLLGNATLGLPLNLTAYPVFRFGANETGSTPIRGNASISQVRPTVISITKTSDAPEDETATGHNFIRTYTLIVDVARGRTVNNVVVRDDIPYNLEFIKVTSPVGVNITHYPTKSQHGLTINLGNLIGESNTPFVITYTVYANKTDIYGNPVLNLTTGASTNATNIANATGTYQSIPVSAADNYTLTLRSLAIQKGVTDLTNPGASRPLDILRYNLDFQVSDYFGMSNLVIRDTMGDGQSFLDWPIRNSTYTPKLNLHLPTGTITNLSVDLTNLNQFQYVYNSTTGITYLTFNISQILIDNGYLINGTLYGGNFTGTDFGATQGSLTYWSKINIYHENDTLILTPHPIVSNDAINNGVAINANPLNTNVVSDGSGSSVPIVAPTPVKTILKINGNDPVGPPYVIQPGDTVTFSLIVDVPTTNLNDFYLIDYLPIPFLRANQFTTGQPQNTTLLIPAAGQWRLGATDTLSFLSGVTPSLIVDATQNTLRFDYGNIYNSTQPNAIAHILFTVTATGDPMVDGLYLTNLLNIDYENSPGEIFTDNKIVSIVTGEPKLTITKTATPTTNLQAGDVVTYTITISNTGHAPAYNVIVKDNLFTANPGYIASTSMAARYVNGTAITGLTLSDLFTPGGLNFTALWPIYGVNGTNNTIEITYNAILNSTVYPRQFINNTVNITQYTSLPLPGSPNYVTTPINSSASVQARDVNMTKTYVSSVDGVSSTPNLTIGERGLFRIAVTLPAGQIHDLNIRDSLPAGLSYVSYALDLTGYSGTLAPLTFSQVGNILNFTFVGATNTTANSTFYINLTLRANNNTPYPGATNVTALNNATMDWNDPGHTPINRNASVYIIQPLLNVTKTFTPSTVQGGQLVQVRIRVTNSGSATAQHVIITDPLNGSGSIFDLASVVSYNQNGFNFTYPSNTVTFSWGNINPGQTLDFLFNITTLDTPYIGPSYLNIANATYWSLPWNGTNPDTNSRNYTRTGSATLLTGDPSVNKTIVSSSIHEATGNLTIGEVVTYRLRITLPQGLMTNLR